MPDSNSLVPLDLGHAPALTHLPSDPLGRMSRASYREANPARLIQQALTQWWKVALIAALMLSTAAVAIVMYTFRPVYRAAVLMQIQEQAPFVVGPIGPASSLYVPTQIEILRSRIVLEPVVEQPDIAGLPELQEHVDPLQSLAARIRVSAVGTSELYEVSCDAFTPENASLLANRIVDSYFDYRALSETDRTRRVIELLEAERQRRDEKLVSLRDRFRELGGRLAESGVLATAGPASAKSPMPSTLQDRIVLAEVERQVLEAKIRSLTEASSGRPPVTDAEIAAAIDADPRVTKTAASLQSLYDTLHQVAVTSADGQNSVAYKRTQNDIERFEKSLADLRESLRADIVQRLSSVAQAKQATERREMETSVESYRLMEETLRERYREQLAKNSEATSASLDLEIIRSELEREENVQEMLAERAAALRTELGARSKSRY